MTYKIAGTPDPEDMVRPFGLVFIPADDPEAEYDVDVVALTVPKTGREGEVRFVRVPYTMEQFYELREAVNDLYDHIRQEQPSD